ncbi:MAG: aminomethyltransferase, partial [Chloroflexota bacterium]|nr:aminomethyltransferase [Chloroflexota bacterium]
MIRTTPFHERISALNETGLWEHWSNHLTATRYQMSEKFEYFAIRNAAGLFDSSPLYKYRIHGPDAERFLAGALARDIRTCPPGHAQYTIWCDDRGYVVEDGVILRHGPDEFVLTAAEPNLAYFEELIGRLDVGIEEVSDDWAVLAVQGPRSRDLLAALDPAVAKLP